MIAQQNMHVVNYSSCDFKGPATCTAETENMTLIKPATPYQRPLTSLDLI